MLMLLHEKFIRAFYLPYRADFFTRDVTNSGLHTAFFYFFNLPYSRLVTGLVSLLITQPLYIHKFDLCQGRQNSKFGTTP